MGAWGLPSTFLSYDAGCSRISGSTHQGVLRRHFLMLMVGTLGSPSAPARGPTVDIFLMLMVGAPKSPSAHTRGPPLMFFDINGGRYRISISTRQGGRHRYFWR
jgi:hypothetical protein